jgi:hypothetical protein
MSLEVDCLLCLANANVLSHCIVKDILVVNNELTHHACPTNVGGEFLLCDVVTGDDTFSFIRIGARPIAGMRHVPA